MKRPLRFEKERDLKGLRAASFRLLLALTAVVAASTALAQVTPVLPFVGDHSETWEEFSMHQPIASGTSILGGIATISGPNMETAGPGMFLLCSMNIGALPSDGTVLMDSFFPSGPVTISFSQPVSAFGAYWATCADQTDITLNFLDANGSLVGTDTFGYSGGNPPGALEWHGYAFSTPVRTIIRNTDFHIGTATDGIQVRVGPIGPPLNLGNISTRGLVQTGDQVMIGGFVIGGNAPKQVLIRAIGPTLANQSVTGSLQDPMLSLHDTHAEIASNDDWQSAANAGQIPTNLKPGDPRESAILISLQPGQYTAIVSGKGGTTGVGLVEVYDLEPTSDSTLSNISTRGFVGTGDSVMIGGFVAGGSNNGITRLLVRAIGPSLSGSGVANPLPNPVLRLFNANGQRIESNDNWQDTNGPAIMATGLAPTNNLESAIWATLLSGSYTAIVSDTSGGSGVALVEVFRLQ